MSETPLTIADDLVVELEYTLYVDGKVEETSEGEEPLAYLHGHDNVISGLENAIAGLKVGDKLTVDIPAEDAYGQYDAEGLIEVHKEDIPEEIPLEVGVEIYVTDDDGDEGMATIARVTKNMVELDFNHPLAGKDLRFDILVLNIREADPEELEHGHVHIDGMHDHDDEE
jgi:FKBP-type peptidyl-prolyl cis-trans isomerase SlyD